MLRKCHRLRMSCKVSEFLQLPPGPENISALSNPWGGGEDILAQWRLQRKMELAQEKVGAGSRLVPTAQEYKVSLV